jgi:hypothetical protein
VGDDLEETLLEFVLLTGDDVVMHADGGHDGTSLIVREGLEQIYQKENKEDDRLRCS